MSLILKLAPGERLFINGAVVTNGDRRAYLMVETKAQIVREKDVLLIEDASTPVRRAYFAAQAVLLNAQPVLGSSEAFAEQVRRLRGVFLKAEHIALLDEAEAQMHDGNIYRALSALRELVLYEAALLGLAPPERFRRDGSKSEQGTAHPHPAMVGSVPPSAHTARPM
ncbi:flagellum biosynthesis repressor protein FlbT family protein [Acetobacteraceae bacterium AT-5844]|nr:flagellum biosynthesis repressor protein FlbT family protein [Acetobacteraceae bacterium AT-5844]